MKRREFLGKAAASAALLAGCAPQGQGGAAAAGALPTVRWRMASSFPRSLDTIYGAAEVLAEQIDAMTGGKFTIRVYQAGELVPGLQVMDAVQQESVQVGHTASYYYTGKNPALAFDACVPFGFTARQQNAWLLEGGGLELLRGVFSDFNIINFPAGNTGAQMGGWFKEQVNSLADLQGLKMRIPGLGGEVMSRLGVNVQVLAGGDIYPALERGAIDATEWVGPYDDEKLGFHQVAKHYYYPGWWEPGPNLSYLVNLNAWNELPAAYKAIFRTAASYSAQVMQSRYDQKNPGALQRILASDVTLHPFADDIMVAARDASVGLLQEQAAADPGYRRIYDSWREFQAASRTWMGTAELAYSQFSFGSSGG